MGDIKIFNMVTGEEDGTYPCHDSYVYHVQPSRDGRSLITSSSWRTPYSKLHSLFEGGGARETYTFKEEEYLEFSSTQDKLIGTRLDGEATDILPTAIAGVLIVISSLHLVILRRSSRPRAREVLAVWK